MNIHQDILLSIQKIARHWEQVTIENHSVSRIDKDILLNHVRQLYERLLELDTEPSRTLRKAEVRNPAAPIPLSNIESHAPMRAHKAIEKPLEKITPKQSGELAEEKKTEEIKSAESVAPDEKQGIAEPKTGVPYEKPLILESEQKSQSRKPVSTADKFAAQKTLADRFAKDSDQSFAAKLKNNKLYDIKSAIGINDRFLFINELFKGDQQQYQEVITKINTCENYPEALQYLDQVKTRNQIENNEALTTLLDIVKRKYQ